MIWNPNLIKIPSPRLVHQLIAKDCWIILKPLETFLQIRLTILSLPLSHLSPKVSKLLLVLSVKLLEGVGNLLSEVPTGPGGVARGVEHWPRVRM